MKIRRKAPPMAEENAHSVPAAAMFGARGTLMGTCRSLSGHCAFGSGLR
ncbi:hypothetical protein [Alloprevotella tannerae]|nr:hypothetical protein [Alloprevotella tannerae]